MAITKTDLYANIVTVSGGSATVSVTVPSGTEMLVVRTVTAFSAPYDITYNGSALTSRVSESDSNSRASSIWDLESPTAGTHNVVISCGDNTVPLIVTALQGIDTGTPRGTPQSHAGYASSRTITLTTTAGDLCLDIFSSGASVTADGSQTTQWSGAGVGSDFAGASSKIASGSSTTMLWSGGAFSVLVGIPYVMGAGGGSVAKSVPWFFLNR